MKFLTFIFALFLTLNAHCGIFISTKGVASENTNFTSSRLVYFGSGAVVLMAGVLIANNSSNILNKIVGVSLIFLNEDVGAEHYALGLQKTLPEINDQTIINELAELAISSKVEGSSMINLDSHEVKMILERSDLTDQQISRLVEILK